MAVGSIVPTHRPGHPNMNSRTLAIVTGASGGIGKDLAILHAAAGGNLVLVARSHAGLLAVKAEVERDHGVTAHVVPLDLAVSGAAQRLADYLASERLEPGILLNNAGVGGLGRFDQQDIVAVQRMLAVNVCALTELCRLLLPGMRLRGAGRIMNVASAAAFMPGPLHAVYYATKAYVLSLSEALAIECEGSGVSVTAVCPGPVQSGFLARAGGPAVNVFKSLGSREVAGIAYAAMLAGKKVVVPGRVLRLMLALAPRSWLARQTFGRNELILQAMGPAATRRDDARAQSMTNTSP